MISPDFSIIEHVGLRILFKNIHNKAVNLYGPLNYSLEFKSIGSDAGQFLFSEGKIILNSYLLRKFPYHSLNVYAHELSHLIFYKIYGFTDNHCENWQNIGLRLGFSIEEFHNLKL